MSGERLLAHREMWRSKPALRGIYEHLYRNVARACRPGKTLEIGGGAGSLPLFFDNVVTSDIERVPWLDVVCDAHRLPFAEDAFENIVMVDVLHHLHRPRRFFSEATRVLRAGGRIVMMEPAITPFSWPFYRWLHPEPMRLDEDPLAEGDPDPSRDPFDANQAIPTLLFRRKLAAFEHTFPALRLSEFRYMGLWAYPLSGGFRRWSLIPKALVKPVLWVEDRLAPALGPMCAFRLMAVLEKG